MTENIDSFKEEIESYLKNENFNIFVTKKTSLVESLSEIYWDSDQDWKDFFSIAKNDEATTIIEELETFTEDNLDMIEEVLEDIDDSSDLENIKDDIQDNLGTVVGVSFSWIKNNVRYVLSKQTEQLEKFNKELASLKKKRFHERVFSTADTVDDDDDYEDDGKISKEILEKDPNELADQYVEFMEKEYPDGNRMELWTTEKEFFETIGIPANVYDEKARRLTERVSALARRIMEKNEKEALPELIDECVDWAEENDLSKVTKTLVIGFLAEKGLSLFQTNKDILHTKVNFKLKSK